MRLLNQPDLEAGETRQVPMRTLRLCRAAVRTYAETFDEAADRAAQEKDAPMDGVVAVFRGQADEARRELAVLDWLIDGECERLCGACGQYHPDMPGLCDLDPANEAKDPRTFRGKPLGLPYGPTGFDEIGYYVRCPSCGERCRSGEGDRPERGMHSDINEDAVTKSAAMAYADHYVTEHDHELAHFEERQGGEKVDRRICQGLGCPFGGSVPS